MKRAAPSAAPRPTDDLDLCGTPRHTPPRPITGHAPRTDTPRTPATPAICETLEHRRHLAAAGFTEVGSGGNEIHELHGLRTDGTWSGTMEVDADWTPTHVDVAFGFYPYFNGQTADAKPTDRSTGRRPRPRP